MASPRYYLGSLNPHVGERPTHCTTNMAYAGSYKLSVKPMKSSSRWGHTPRILARCQPHSHNNQRSNMVVGLVRLWYHFTSTGFHPKWLAHIVFKVHWTTIKPRTTLTLTNGECGTLQISSVKVLTSSSGWFQFHAPTILACCQPHIIHRP